ncbi:hypothetical protein P7C70_g6974, partial [Phenoliferia sp. Uapishka_3]
MRIVEGQTRSPAGLDELIDFVKAGDEGDQANFATLDALSFLIAYSSYQASFRSLPASLATTSPSPYSIISSLGSLARAAPGPSQLARHSRASLAPLPSPSSLYSINLSLSSFPLPRSIVIEPNPFLDTEKSLPPIPLTPPPLLERDSNPFLDPTSHRLTVTFAENSSNDRSSKPTALQEAILRRRQAAGLSNDAPSLYSRATVDSGSFYTSGIPTSDGKLSSSGAPTDSRWSDPFEFATHEPPPGPEPPQKDQISLAPTLPLRLPAKGVATTPPPPASRASFVSSAATVLPNGLDPKTQPLRSELENILRRFFGGKGRLGEMVPERMFSQALLEGAYPCMGPLVEHRS